MAAYPPEYDDPCICEICGKDAEDCECPECPWCGAHGDPQCSVNGGAGCDAPPDFEVRKTIRRGGLTIEAGNVDGWNVLRYIRAGWTATAIVAYSDEWFFLRVWPASVLGMEDGLAGIMREVLEVA